MEDLPQLRNGQWLPYALLGNGKILAEGAAEVAAGEKDGPSAMFAHKARFLPKMQHRSCRHRGFRGPAEPASLVGSPFRAAVPGTEGAKHMLKSGPRSPAIQ